MRITTLTFLLILISVHILAQDSIQTQPNKLKNYIGLSISPALTGYISDKSIQNPLLPVFIPSFYFTYDRVLSKRFWLNVGLGMMVTGSTLNFNYDPLEADYLILSSKTKSTSLFYDISLFVKPKYVFCNKKIIVYGGIIAQINKALANQYSFKAYDRNDNIMFQTSEFKFQQNNKLYVFSGIFGGLGFKYRKFLFTAEPEFKILTNFLFDTRFSNKFIQYSLGFNFIAAYNF